MSAEGKPTLDNPEKKPQDLPNRVLTIEENWRGLRTGIGLTLGFLGFIGLASLTTGLDKTVNARVGTSVSEALETILVIAVDTALAGQATKVEDIFEAAIIDEVTEAAKEIEKVVETAIVVVAGTQAAEATPTPTPTATPTPLFTIQGDCDEFAPPCTYRVKSGDNYLFIADSVYADRNHAPLIMSYNRDDNGYRSLLVTDQLVFIPSATDPPPLSYLDDCGPGIKYPCLYIVQLGDT